MRRPVVDYRQLRLSNITDKRFNHLLFGLCWVTHFVLYYITESLIPAESCYVVHGLLDDVIPFCEIFIVPYTVWYFAIAATMIYFALYSPDSYKSMMKFLIVTQAFAMAIYIIFPNRQDLRPTEFLRDNIFTDITALIYNADTNTNVCPSLHVAYSIGIASTWLKEKSASPLAKTLITAFFVLVCISVVFVKQHSVVDIYVALPICALAELLVFGKYWKGKILIKREKLRTT